MMMDDETYKVLKRKMKIGVPVHMEHGPATACGLAGKFDKSDDYKVIDCMNCTRTRAFRELRERELGEMREHYKEWAEEKIRKIEEASNRPKTSEHLYGARDEQ